MPVRGLFFNKFDLYEDKIKKIISHANSNGLMKLDCLQKDCSYDTIMENFLIPRYNFLIHRNEHGCLFKGGSLRHLTKTAHEKSKPVLNFDFGYFNHYKSFMFDFYLNDMSSSIKLDWESLSPNVNWNCAPKYIREYRDGCRRSVSNAVGETINSQDLSKCVVIWMQWNTELLRNSLFVNGQRIPQYQWVNLIAAKIKSLGLVPVVKLNIANHSEIYNDTVPNIDKSLMLVTNKEEVHASNRGSILDFNANNKLIANAKYHVILCSSVSNEIVFNDKPIIATGKSWFNGFDIFYEPKSWDDPFSEPVVNSAARNKWINWWLSRQVELKNSDEKIMEIYNKALAYLNKPVDLDWQI